MNFFGELNMKKKSLKPTKTIVTSLMGEKYLEEKNESGKVMCKFLDTCTGFVVDAKPDLEVTQILEYLFLGSQDVAQEINLLKKHGITHVLSIGVDVNKSSSCDIIFKKVDLLDEPSASLNGAFDSCFEFIESAKTQNKKNKVYVHCNAGYSRAPTIVIGYIMKSTGCSLEEALERVKKKRNIQPNSGFMKQLRAYENLLKM